MRIKNIEKPYQLLAGFLKALIPFNEAGDSYDLPILFHKKRVDLECNPCGRIKEATFLNDQLILEGALLGRGGMKSVYHVNGKAIFLIACKDINRLEEIIEEEVLTSHQLKILGLYAQVLTRDYIEIYDPAGQCYYQYPCMYSDSFSTMSREKNIEVFDVKNTYRFGKKYKLYPTHDDCLDVDLTRVIFEDILDDLALLLYLGLQINVDFLNLAFMPSKHDRTLSTVRLFLYDFSSKFYNPRKELELCDLIPPDSKIKALLKTIIAEVLRADSIARTGYATANPLFFKEVYPLLEAEFADKVKDKIERHMKTQDEFKKRTLPALAQSAEIKKSYDFFKSAKKEPSTQIKRAASCPTFTKKEKRLTH